jgi:hypothetical protein
MHLLELLQHPQDLFALSGTRYKWPPYEYRVTEDDEQLGIPHR